MVDGWNRYQMLVLQELKRLDSNDKELSARLDQLRGEISKWVGHLERDVTTLKVKIAVASSVVATIVSLAVKYLL